MWELISAINDALTIDQPVLQAFGFLAALPLVSSALGSIFGKAAGGRAQGRAEEARLLTDRDRNEIDKYQTAQNAQMQAGNLDLQRKGFGEAARGGRAKQAMIASLLGNMQDVNVSVPGITNASVGGGIRPSAMGAGGKQAANELMKQALLAQMTPDQFQGGNILSAPRASALPKPSGLDKFLNIAGLVGSAVGGVGSVLKGLSDDENAVPIPSVPTFTGLPGVMPGTPVDLPGPPTQPPPFRFTLDDYRRGGSRG